MKVIIKLIYDSLNAETCFWHNEMFFLPKQSVHRTVEISFCIPFSYPIHQSVLHPWEENKEAKLSMLCNSTVKQAMELMAKKNRAKQTKGIHRTANYCASEFP